MGTEAVPMSPRAARERSRMQLFQAACGTMPFQRLAATKDKKHTDAAEFCEVLAFGRASSAPSWWRVSVVRLDSTEIFWIMFFQKVVFMITNLSSKKPRSPLV